jgi:protocatechuate 3,4-dioxygenase beta subunit
MAIQWQTATLQVGLFGRVTDARTGAPLAGVRVDVADGPAAFDRTQALRAKGAGPAWAAMERRPGRTVTGEDGAWHLADLPPGGYQLAFSLPRAAARYGTAQASATLKARTGGGVTPLKVDAALAPTFLEGRVTDPGGTAVPMAEVSLRGSAERALTGSDGRWKLVGVEPGARQVRISARGFQPATRDVTLASPGASQTVDVQLAT